jgi:hypothetical protein
MLGRVLALALLCGGLCAAPAAAQLPTPDPGLYVPDYGAMISQDTFLRQALGQPASGKRVKAPPKKTTKKPRPPKRATAKQRATLKFGADPAVSTAVDQFFVENFAAPGVAPETVIADLARLREAGHADLRLVRWNRRHLGDVAAYALLVGYGSVNDTTKLSTAGMRKIRRAVTDELATTKGVRRLPDAEQQRIGELLLLRLGYYVGWRNDLAAKGDPDGAEELRRDLRRFIRSVYGVDVGDVRLTAKGFSAK